MNKIQILKLILFTSAVVCQYGNPNGENTGNCNPDNWLDDGEWLDGNCRTLNAKPECQYLMRIVSKMSRATQEKICDKYKDTVDVTVCIEYGDDMKTVLENELAYQAVKNSDKFKVQLRETRNPVACCCKSAKESYETDSSSLSKPEDECANFNDDAGVFYMKESQCLKDSMKVALTSKYSALFQDLDTIRNEAVYDDYGCVDFLKPTAGDADSIINTFDLCAEAQDGIDQDVAEKSMDCINKMSLMPKCQADGIVEFTEDSSAGLLRYLQEKPAKPDAQVKQPVSNGKPNAPTKEAKSSGPQEKKSQPKEKAVNNDAAKEYNACLTKSEAKECVHHDKCNCGGQDKISQKVKRMFEGKRLLQTKEKAKAFLEDIAGMKDDKGLKKQVEKLAKQTGNDIVDKLAEKGKSVCELTRDESLDGELKKKLGEVCEKKKKGTMKCIGKDNLSKKNKLFDDDKMKELKKGKENFDAITKQMYSKKPKGPRGGQNEQKQTPAAKPANRVLQGQQQGPAECRKLPPMDSKGKILMVSSETFERTKDACDYLTSSVDSLGYQEFCGLMNDPEKCNFGRVKIFTLFNRDDLNWKNFCEEKNSTTCIYRINLAKGVLTTSCEKNTICKNDNKLSEKFNKMNSDSAGQKKFSEEIPATEIVILKRDIQEPVMLVKEMARSDDRKPTCAVVDGKNEELRNMRKPADCLAQSGIFPKPAAGKIHKKDKERERDPKNAGLNKDGEKVTQVDVNSTTINGEKCFANMKADCSSRLNKNCPIASRKGAPPNGHIRESFKTIIIDDMKVEGQVTEAEAASNKLDRASLALHMLTSNSSGDSIASPHEFKEFAECVLEDCTSELSKVVEESKRRALFVKRQMEVVDVNYRSFRTANNIDTQLTSINAEAILDKNIEIEGATTQSLPDDSKLAESMLIQQDNIIDVSKAGFLNVCIYALLLISAIMF